MTDPTTIPFVIYGTVAIALTGWLARTLHRNGELFLEHAFEDKRLAGAINNLLVIGFFMLNLGYALLISRIEEATSTFQAAQNLTLRLGTLLVSLGVIHFVNMAVIWRLRVAFDPDKTLKMLPTRVTGPAPMPAPPMPVPSVPPPPTAAARVGAAGEGPQAPPPPR